MAYPSEGTPTDHTYAERGKMRMLVCWVLVVNFLVKTSASLLGDTFSHLGQVPLRGHAGIPRLPDGNRVTFDWVLPEGRSHQAGGSIPTQGALLATSLVAQGWCGGAWTVFVL